MRIICLGGGPAGLYLAISIKLRRPDWSVRVVERNKAGDTFGWGVVFSDQTLANLMANDPVSAATIAASFAHWDDIDVVVGQRQVRSSGHGFIGIGRKRLLNILQDRARELGVELEFETEFSDDVSTYGDYDLIVAADGINSRIRTRYVDKFGPDLQTRTNKFMWLGTTRLFDAFAFIFEETPAGYIWAHAYRFDATHSTFIVECSEATWRGLGFDAMEPEEALAACERLFARHLDGHALITNAGHLRGSAAWLSFRRVLCAQWSFDNVVLLGDAAHTAHFSIGSGTKLALEDAILLAEVLDSAALDQEGGLGDALLAYQAVRHQEVLKIQNAARNSTEWFETLDRYIGFDLPQFAYALLTRSQRVSHENLRLRDPVWLASVERWFQGRDGTNGDPRQPLFTPYRMRGLTLINRVVLAPVYTYAAQADGTLSDFHQVHYGARALGGAGLIMTEMLAVSPEGRATPACPGLWSDDQIAAWARLTDFVHAHGDSRICAQIGHAGARASAAVPGGGTGYDVPLGAGGWPIVSASALPWQTGGQIPAELSLSEMDRVRDAFVDAARRVVAAGFDMIELQAGHGTLLAAFLSPLMNHRTDTFGGAMENRMRWPLAVVQAVRAVLPDGMPLAVRISATDWAGAAGTQPADAVEIARALGAAGADLIDVSSGETTPDARPVYGRMFQTPLADQIRNEAGVATIAVGNITEPDQVNGILVAGRADLVAIGRPHLVDPMWVARAAAGHGPGAVRLPAAYQPGMVQLSRLLARSGEALVG